MIASLAIVSVLHLVGTYFSFSFWQAAWVAVLPNAAKPQVMGPTTLPFLLLLFFFFLSFSFSQPKRLGFAFCEMRRPLSCFQLASTTPTPPPKPKKLRGGVVWRGGGFGFGFGVPNMFYMVLIVLPLDTMFSICSPHQVPM